MPGFQITQSNSPWAEVFGNALDDFGDALPEIVEYRRAAEEDENFRDNLSREYIDLLSDLRDNRDLETSLINSGTLQSEGQYEDYISDLMLDIDGIDNTAEMMRRVDNNLQKVTALGGNVMSDDWLINYATQFENDAARGQLDTNRGNRARVAQDENTRAMQQQLMQRYEEDPRGAMLAMESNPQVRETYGDYWDRREGYREEDDQLQADEEAITAREESWNRWGNQADRILSGIDNPGKAYTIAMDRFNDEDIAQNARDRIMQRNAIRETERAETRRINEDEEMNRLGVIEDKAEAVNSIQNRITEAQETINEYKAELTEADDATTADLKEKISNLKFSLGVLTRMRNTVQAGEFGALSDAGAQEEVSEFQSREEVRSEAPTIIREKLAQYEEDVSGISLRNIFSRGRPVHDEAIAEMNETINSYGFRAERDGNDVKFFDIANNRYITIEELEAELGGDIADESAYPIDRGTQYGGNSPVPTDPEERQRYLDSQLGGL